MDVRQPRGDRFGGDALRVADAGRLWSPADVCWYLGIRPRTLREWRATDASFPLPLALPGRVVRWLPAHVVAWASRRSA